MMNTAYHLLELYHPIYYCSYSISIDSDSSSIISMNSVSNIMDSNIMSSIIVMIIDSDIMISNIN